LSRKRSYSKPLLKAEEVDNAGLAFWMENILTKFSSNTNGCVFKFLEAAWPSGLGRWI